MRKLFILAALSIFILPLEAQQTYSLQQCREMALQNNKQLAVARIQQSVAANNHKAAQTKYLPRVDGMAGYQHFSREISLLNKQQKSSLSNLGTNTIGQVGNDLASSITNLVNQGALTQSTAEKLSALLGQIGTPLVQAGNNIGQSIRDAFRTNTKNLWAGSVTVTQPLYMGGAIRAANEMAKIGEDMAQNDVDARTQSIIFATDNTYWLAISLRNKERLAQKYRDLVAKLNSDVHKMIREGVATRSDGLKTDVAVNTADIALTKAQDGVSITKMALCELCGLPLDTQLNLADEDEKGLVTGYDVHPDPQDSTYSQRPEIRLLGNAIDMSKQTTKLLRAAYLPHVALTGGVLFSNPNVYNGFQENFKDLWSIGVVVQVPLWTWHEGRYKIRAAQSLTQIAETNLQDARNKVNLEVSECRFKVKEAYKKLNMAQSNMHSAEENLRCANVGFKEGVMTVTDVMEAQTAWQQAFSQKIDAEIEVRVTQAALQKALGTLY